MTSSFYIGPRCIYGLSKLLNQSAKICVIRRLYWFLVSVDLRLFVFCGLDNRRDSFPLSVPTRLQIGARPDGELVRQQNPVARGGVGMRPTAAVRFPFGRKQELGVRRLAGERNRAARQVRGGDISRRNPGFVHVPPELEQKDNGQKAAARRMSGYRKHRSQFRRAFSFPSF